MQQWTHTIGTKSADSVDCKLLLHNCGLLDCWLLCASLRAAGCLRLLAMVCGLQEAECCSSGVESVNCMHGSV